LNAPSNFPEPGRLIQLRQRRWLVEAVERAGREFLKEIRLPIESEIAKVVRDSAPHYAHCPLLTATRSYGQPNSFAALPDSAALLRALYRV
jgi:hypothetical protein